MNTTQDIAPSLGADSELENTLRFETAGSQVYSNNSTDAFNFISSNTLILDEKSQRDSIADLELVQDEQGEDTLPSDGKRWLLFAFIRVLTNRV